MRDVAETSTAGLWPVALNGVALRAGGQTLIDGLNLALEPGPLTCVMGPNGAGKSLLVRLIAGLIHPTGGTISYGGASAPPKNRIAVVFQRPVLLRRSAAANLDHALKTYGVPRVERPGRIAALPRRG